MTTAAAPSARPLLTVEEYRARARRSDVRHEYVDGRAYATSGSSRDHNRVVLNVAIRLFAAARGGRCRVSVDSVRLVAGDEEVYYPDVMVACGPPPSDPYAEVAPCVLVQVLSPTARHITARRIDEYDRGLAYRALPSLRTYLIVDQPQRRVEWYTRAAGGLWRVTDLVGSGAVTFPCPAGADDAPVSMTFDEIYGGVELPPERPARRTRAR